jgi:hypothetical protein
MNLEEFDVLYNAFVDASAPLIARLELRKFKHLKAASQETNWFTAQLWLDCRLIGYAQNDGHGGCTDYVIADDATHAELTDFVASIRTDEQFGLDVIIDHMVSERIADDDWSTYRRRVCKGGGVTAFRLAMAATPARDHSFANIRTTDPVKIAKTRADIAAKGMVIRAEFPVLN